MSTRRTWGSHHKGAVLGVVLGLVLLAVLAAGCRASTPPSTSPSAAASTGQDQALSRRVAARARTLAATDPAVAGQLAVAGYRAAPTTQALGALLETSGRPFVTALVDAGRAAPQPIGHAMAAIGADGTIDLYRAAEKDGAPQVSTTPASSVTVADGTPSVTAWSTNGRWLAYGGPGGSVGVLDARDLAHPTVVASTTYSSAATVNDLMFADRDRTLYVASSDDRVLQYSWDAHDLQQRGTATGFQGAVRSLAIPLGNDYFRRGLLATGSADGAVRLWRQTPHGPKLTSVLHAGRPGGVVGGITFEWNGEHLAAALDDGTVQVWDMWPRPHPIARLRGFHSAVGAIAFSNNSNQLLAGDKDGLLLSWAIWNWALDESHQTPSAITHIDSTMYGEPVVSGADGVSRIWPVTAPLRVLGDDIRSLSRTETDAVLYFGSGPAAPVVQGIVMGQHPPVLRSRPGPGYSAPASAGGLDGASAASPSAQWLAGGTLTGNIAIWPIGIDRTHPLIVRAATSAIESVDFSSDSTVVVATSDDGSATVYDLTGQQEQPVVKRRLTIAGHALAGSISPDDAVLAVGGSDGLVHLVAMGTGATLSTLRGFPRTIDAVSFSPDGNRLAAGGADGTVRLFDVTDPAHPAEIGTPPTGPSGTVHDVAWSPDGSLVATPSTDGHVWLWRVTDQGLTAYAALANLGSAPTAAVFSADSQTVFAGGLGGRLAGWSLSPDEVSTMICARRGTPLTAAEWHRYVPASAYPGDPCA